MSVEKANTKNQRRAPHPYVAPAFIVAAAWTVAVAVVACWHLLEVHKNTLESARIQASHSFEKDLVYRRWAAGHGGVYVRVTEDTPPNPYLSHMENRDVTTTSGLDLTLVNPAYMTRQVHELGEEQYGYRGHITSLNPLRPENAPDAWEAEALRAFERGETEVAELAKVGDTDYMRLMRPMITEPSCMKCHAEHGYKVGDLRGGISVAVPMEPLWTVMHGHMAGVTMGHGLIWLLGLGGIALGASRMRRRIAERDRAEERALRFSRVLAGSLNEIYLFDAETLHFIEVNRGARENLGYSLEELRSLTPLDLKPEFTAESFAELVEPLRSGDQETIQFTTVHRRKDGSLYPVEVHLQLMTHGAPVFVAIILDITKRKRAEDEGHRLATVVRHSRELVNMATLEGKMLFLNETGSRMLGIDPGDVEQVNIMEVIPEHLRGLVQSELLPALLEGGAWEGDLQYRNLKTGELVDVHAMTFSINDPDTGKPLFLANVSLDISERKRAEETLRESEERLRQIAETIEDVFWITDWQNHKTLFASRAYERIWGRSLQDLYADARNWADAIHPEDRERAWENFVKLGDGDSYDEEYRIVRPDGSMRRIRDRGFPVRDVSGHVYRVAGIAQDITDRKLAEEALRDSEERHRALFESSRDAIMTLAPPSWRFTSGNPATVEMFGAQDEADFVSRALWEYSPPSQPDGRVSPEKAKEMIETAMREGSHFFEWRHKRLDGQEFPATVLLTRFELAGQVLLQATVRDVSVREELEEQLRQSQKLEAIGQLAGGVAHDFNNILTGIKGYLEFALKTTEPGTQIHEDLTETSALADRAADLTRQLLAFSRRQTLEVAVLNANQLITNQLKMLGRLLGEDIDIRFLPAADLGNVRADPSQIQQVMMNLALNARDAMPDGGRLTIETDDAVLSQEYADQHVGVTPGSYVMIAVSDTGCGIDEKTRTQVFEPFFTTKEVGQGTGLGLSTVYGIVKQHGGNVWVYSEPREGTTFKVYLPAVAKETTERRSTRPRVVGGSETILLVEDEAAVREVAQRFLDELGYRVLAASAPDEAEDVAAGESQIDLLLTDVVLPDRDGRVLYESLAAARPGLTVLYMSGHTDDALAHRGVLDAGTPFLPKPFDEQTLAAKVRDVLDSSRDLP